MGKHSRVSAYQVGLQAVQELRALSLAGIAAAITDAVYHATGFRIRERPVKIEDLLAAPIKT